LSSPPPDAGLYLRLGPELALSGPALLELLRPVLARGLPFRFRAGGHSMLPFIQDGDLLSIRPQEKAHLRIGQVVAYIHPDRSRLVVHRVVGRSDGAFLLQGDNLPGQTDGLVPSEDILGRVVSVERRGQPVRLGLGPEGWGIALLSRAGWLRPLVGFLARLAPRRPTVRSL
jgi:signal peptidase I